MTLSEALAATAIMQVSSVANVLVFRVMDYVFQYYGCSADEGMARSFAKQP